MLTLIHGADSFRSRQALQQLEKQFSEKYDPQKLNREIFDFAESHDENDALKKITLTIINPSFFGQKKLIIIKNFFISADKKTKDNLMQFLKKQKNLTDEIVFYEKKQIPANDLKKIPGQIQSFNLLKAYELEKWVKTYLQNKNKSIEQQALAKLCFEVGNNLAQMDQEINKLINYNTQTQTISLESVNLLVDQRNEDNIFLLTDALASRDKKRALKLLNDQFQLGAHPLYLLKMFAFAFRNLLTVKELLEKNFALSEIKEKSKLHPFLVQKIIQQAHKFQFVELKKIYLKLIDLDFALKTGKIEGRRGLEIFVSLL